MRLSRVWLWALTVLWGCVLGAQGMLSYSIKTIAGTGTGQCSGDGGPASSAALNHPHGVCEDTAGNLFIGDYGNHRIRKIAAGTGIITTFAGSGSAGFAGDGLQATASSVMLNYPVGVWMSSANVLYIADYSNHRIRSVSSSGIIGTFAGTGNSATSLYLPHVAMGTTSGVIYIADTHNHRIRAVDASGIMTVIAGNGGTAVADNVAPTSSGLYSPTALWLLTNGDYYIADHGNHRIRKVSNNIITTVAGGGTSFADNEQATASSLNYPYGVWVSNVDKSVYIADKENYRIRAVDGVTGIISTIAGDASSGQGHDNAAATSSKLMMPVTIYGPTATSLYVVDYGDHKLRLLTSSSPTSQPSAQPSGQPTSQPTQPSAQPTGQPTSQPTQPSAQPTGQPTNHPTRQPINKPTVQPSSHPSQQPFSVPTAQPSGQPTVQPSIRPTNHPTSQPISQPTLQPIARPSLQPSSVPSAQPSEQPTGRPTSQPSGRPTIQPSIRPTSVPTSQPTLQPTALPTSHPTPQPSQQPTACPTLQPSSVPTAQPSAQPTYLPSAMPSAIPSQQPTASPSNQPSAQPLAGPSSPPSSRPSAQPAGRPSSHPSFNPSGSPTARPLSQPSSCPSCQPSAAPSAFPSMEPSTTPSAQPTDRPSLRPSATPTMIPTLTPSAAPSARPSYLHLTIAPSQDPSSCAMVTLTWVSSGSPGSSRDALTIDCYEQRQQRLQSLTSWTANLSESRSVEVPFQLIVGSSYCEATLLVCQDQSDCASKSVDWNVSESMQGSFSIAGAFPRHLSRSQRLRLSAVVVQPECLSDHLLGTTVSWSIVTASGENVTVPSVSKNAAMLVLPAFSLRAGHNYTVSAQLSVADATSYRWSYRKQTSVLVVVDRGAIVPVIADGLQRSLHVGQGLVVDASGSYDENEWNVSTNGGLSGSLRCVEVKTIAANATTSSGGSSCAGVLAIEVASGYLNFSVRSVGVSSDPLVRRAVLELSLSALQSGQSMRVNMSVMVVPRAQPLVVIAGSGSLRVNAATRLTVSGWVTVPPDCVGWTRWTLSRHMQANATAREVWTAVNLTEAQLLTPREVTWTRQSVVQRVDVYCALAAEVLQAGARYQLTLSSWSQVAQSAMHVDIEVNAPPSGGSLEVSPQQGMELQTVFRLRCVNWIDIDLPLTFEFGYRSATGVQVPLSGLTESAQLLSTLLSIEGESTRIWSRVVDGLMAATERAVQVAVASNQSMSAVSQLQQWMQSSVLNSEDMAAVRQRVGIGSSLLNRVECSQAPNCSALHRTGCSRVKHTCGDCESEAFVGVMGDDNSACLSTSSALSASELRQFLASSGCPNGCSAHGQCLQSSHSVGTVCVCAAGYFGTDCSLSLLELQQRRQVRESLVEWQHAMLRLEDASDVSTTELESRLAGVSELAQHPVELSLASTQQLLAATQAVLVDASLSANSAEVLSRLLDSADALSTEDAVVSVAQDSVDLLLESIGKALVPGQSAVMHATSSLRLAVSPLKETSSMSISVPQTLQGQLLGIPPSAVHLNATPVARISSSAFVGVQKLPLSVLVDNASQVVDALRLVSSTSALHRWEGSLAEVSFPMPSSSGVGSRRMQSALSGVESESGAVVVHCLSGVVNAIDARCGEGQTYAVACNGSAAIVEVHCPFSQSSPVCVVSAERSLSSAMECEEVQVAGDEIRCQCMSPLELLRRRRLSANNATTVRANYVAMMRTTSTGFVSTVRSAQQLSLRSARRSWAVVATLVALVGLSLTGLCVTKRWDHRDDKAESVVHDESKTALRRVTLSGTPPAEGSTASSSLLMLLSSALPSSLSGHAGLRNVSSAMKQHHRWIAVAYHFSHRLPRQLRLVSLVSNIVIMLFVQSLTYALSARDDGSCAALRSRTACEAPRSAYRTGQSKCYWYAEDTTESCVFVEPASSLKIVVFVALFGALLSTPLTLLHEWLLFSVLASPSAKERTEVGSAVGLIGGAASVVPVSDAPTEGKATSWLWMRTRAPKSVSWESSREEWCRFEAALQAYRLQLQPHEQREFDGLWGLDSNGEFVEDAPALLRRCGVYSGSSVRDRVQNDMRRCENAVVREWLELHSVHASEQEVSRRVMLHFHKDLLAGLSEQLLDSQDRRENYSQPVRSRKLKLLGWAWLSVVNAGMLFYVFLFGVTKDGERQRAWAQSFAVWLALEVLLFASVMVLVYNVLIPLLLMQDLSKVRSKVVGAIASYSEGQGLRGCERESWTGQLVEFNAAAFLFASHRLASRCADLAVSQVVLEYRTPWPRRSYLHAAERITSAYSKRYATVGAAVAQIALFFLSGVLSCPIHVQNMFLQLCSTVSAGYLLVLHLDLYSVYPLLVLGPSMAVAVAVYCGVLQCSKGGASEPLGWWPSAEAALAHKVSIACQPEDGIMGSGEVYESEQHPCEPPGTGHRNRRESLRVGAQVLQQMEQQMADMGAAEKAESDDDLGSMDISQPTSDDDCP